LALDASGRIRGIRRHPALEKSVNWLKRQIAKVTDLADVKASVIGADEDTLRRRLFRVLNRDISLKLLKWRIATPYVLRVHYLIIAGDEGALHTAESDWIENEYAWDLETEIQREEMGVQAVAVEGDDPQEYDLNTLAFKHFSMTVALDEETEAQNPIQWGTGMHVLEWSVAVRGVTAAGGQVRADLDLFYKCWSEAMNEVITLTTWGAIRSAGNAQLGARLVLLQFKDAESTAQLELPGRIDWPGGGLSASQHPRARLERPVPIA
jgi:hypothetical protein